MKHGVIRGAEGSYDFYWLGNRLSLEEFNEQTYRMATQIKGELEALAQGMDMGSHFDTAKELSIKLDLVEFILRLPLCDSCKEHIGKVT